MSDDPFDDLDPEPRDESDPFDDFETGSDSASGEGDRDDETGDVPSTADGDADRRLDEQPFDDAEDGARPRRRDRDTDPFADLGDVRDDDPFEDGDLTAEDVDDSVWEDLSTTGTETTTEQKGGRRISEVNKHSFCEQCEYFTGPPEIACTHDGTEIEAFLDMETVRIVDCPVVEERERLENAGTQ